MMDWTAGPRSPSANGAAGGKRSNVVYTALRTHALHYRFKPGQHLPISVIAELLKVSNTPVREAMMRLHAEGLVSAISTRGFFARELHLEEVDGAHKILTTMVRQCLEDGDLRHCRVQLEDPRSRLAGLRRRKRVTALTLTCETEMLFETLGRMSGEKTIPRFVRRLCEQTHHIRLSAFENRSIGNRLRHARAALVEALRREDRPAAIEAFAEYSQYFGQALPRLVTQALAVAYAAELTDLAKWVKVEDEAA